MFFDGVVKLVGVRLTEAGIVQVDYEATEAMRRRQFERMAKGEQFVRKVPDSLRELMAVRGALDLDFAHVVSEKFVGQGLDDDPIYSFGLQFAVNKGSTDLLLRLAMRDRVDGMLTVQKLQLELPLGDAVGPDALRQAAGT